jgi:hypothetical protein
MRITQETRIEALKLAIEAHKTLPPSVIVDAAKVFEQYITGYDSLTDEEKDAILIKRIQKAQERKIIHVEVGEMSPHKAENYIENIKKNS